MFVCNKFLLMSRVVVHDVSLALTVTCVTLLLIPKVRNNLNVLGDICAGVIVAIWIEKGMGLVIPGMTPDTLGEIYEYVPSTNEILVSMGVFAIGFLLFTLMVKVATPIMLGEFRLGSPLPPPSLRRGQEGAGSPEGLPAS